MRVLLLHKNDHYGKHYGILGSDLSKEVIDKLSSPINIFIGFPYEFGTIVKNSFFTRLTYSRLDLEFNVIYGREVNGDKFLIEESI